MRPTIQPCASTWSNCNAGPPARTTSSAKGATRAPSSFRMPSASSLSRPAPPERARRRMRDLEARGEHIRLRTKCWLPRTCATRATAPVPWARWCRRPMPSKLSTDGLSPEEVVGRLESIVREKMAAKRVVRCQWSRGQLQRATRQLTTVNSPTLFILPSCTDPWQSGLNTASFRLVCRLIGLRRFSASAAVAAMQCRPAAGR